MNTHSFDTQDCRRGGHRLCRLSARSSSTRRSRTFSLVFLVNFARGMCHFPTSRYRASNDVSAVLACLLGVIATQTVHTVQRRRMACSCGYLKKALRCVSGGNHAATPAVSTVLPALRAGHEHRGHLSLLLPYSPNRASRSVFRCPQSHLVTACCSAAYSCRLFASSLDRGARGKPRV